jgi:SHAQKYF class myb-like DNA-binding protein
VLSPSRNSKLFSGNDNSIFSAYSSISPLAPSSSVDENAPNNQVEGTSSPLYNKSSNNYGTDDDINSSDCDSRLGSSSKQSSGWPKRKRSTAIGVAVQGGDGDNAATTKKQKCAGNVVQKNGTPSSSSKYNNDGANNNNDNHSSQSSTSYCSSVDITHITTTNNSGGSSSSILMPPQTNGGIKMSGKYGRWTPAEKAAFLTGLKRFGRGKWKEIAKLIPTRSTVQVKTHAQMIMRRVNAGEDVFADLRHYENAMSQPVPEKAAAREAETERKEVKQTLDDLLNYVEERVIEKESEVSINIAPGHRLGLDINNRFEIVKIHDDCTFQDSVEVGYRITSINGAPVTSKQDFFVKDRDRVIKLVKPREVKPLLVDNQHLAAKKYNLTIDEFLPDNKSLKECLEMNREDKEELDRLQEEAMKKSKERAAEREAKSEGDVNVEEKYVNMHGINSLISFLGILNYYDDIIDSLVKKKVAMIEHPDSDKPPILLATIPNELAEEKCIGREILEKLGLLGNVKLTTYVKGTYVIEIFSGEEYIRLYKVTDDKITRVKLSINTSDNLFTFYCKLPRDTEHASEAEWKSDRKYWALHRLKQVVYSNLGLGINNREWFRNYFELADDETFEDKFSYYEFDAEAAKKRYRKMKANGWEGVELASQCDGDHLLGRLCMWMCESIFVLPCSHSWNACMAKARQHMGCWGFGFARIKYDGGN